MWIAMNDSFLSIVQHKDRPETLLVRARVSGHIEAVFPGADVLEGLGTDYKYRAFIPRELVADVIAERIRSNLDYPNFKNSVHDRSLHDAYMRVWSTMAGLQR